LARKKRQGGTDFPPEDTKLNGDIKTVIIVPPCDGRYDAHRFTTSIRHGRISFEQFCKNNDRRAELGLSPILEVDSYASE
jgi:hypothetical protein